jgi:Rrf2 family protein
MDSVFKVSKATSIAVHVLLILARLERTRYYPATELAKVMQVSESHLAKVMQKLSKAKYVKSVRGVAGGFVMQKDLDQITLLDVIEIVDGPIQKESCILGEPICIGDECLFTSLNEKLHSVVMAELKSKTLDTIKIKTSFKNAFK